MGFSFTATAQCDSCGQLLGSSDEDCEHNGHSVSTHTFRKLGEGRESLVGVVATAGWKWYKLKESVGDDWIAYQYLGTKGHINALIESGEDVREMSPVTMSCDAPADVMEHDDE